LAAGLGILAGAGALPRLIAEARRTAGTPYLVVSFAAGAEPWMAGHPHELHAFERAGALFAALRRAGCGAVVFAGAMRRPRLRPWRADGATVRLLGRVIRLMGQGDDALLRGVAGILEDEGFAVIGAGDCLPGVVPGPGVLGRVAPSSRDRADAARAAAILAVLGPLDVGQAAVAAGGICLGIEAVEGTDGLLARVAGLLPELRRGRPSGVLVKLAKAGQDRRFDLPSIGPRTVEGAAAAGLRGIAIEAGAANLIEREATIAAADAAGLFLWDAERAEFLEAGG